MLTQNLNFNKFPRETAFTLQSEEYWCKGNISGPRKIQALVLSLTSWNFHCFLHKIRNICVCVPDWLKLDIITSIKMFHELWSMIPHRCKLILSLWSSCLRTKSYGHYLFVTRILWNLNTEMVKGTHLHQNTGHQRCLVRSYYYYYLHIISFGLYGSLQVFHLFTKPVSSSLLKTNERRKNGCVKHCSSNKPKEFILLISFSWSNNHHLWKYTQIPALN